MVADTLQGKSTSLAPPFHAVELVDLATRKTPTTPRPFDHDVLWDGYVVQIPPASGSRTIASEPTGDIDRPSDWFQMIRVDAVSDAAEVVQIQTLRNRTDVAFIKSSMGHLMAVDLSGELRVAGGRDPSSPQPAPRVIHPIGAEVVEQVRPDSIRKLSLLPPAVMAGTPTPDKSTTWGTPTIVSYGARRDR